MFDQPVLVGLGSEKANCDVSLWEGEQVAFIIAETEEAAATALELIEIEWESRPVIDTVFEAFSDAHVLHPAHGSNTVTSYKFRKGDMDTGWAEAEVIVEGTYELPYQEHAYLQPEAGIAYIDEEDRITLFGLRLRATL